MIGIVILLYLIIATFTFVFSSFYIEEVKEALPFAFFFPVTIPMVSWRYLCSSRASSKVTS
jgi:hypothetical protein